MTKKSPGAIAKDKAATRRRTSKMNAAFVGQVLPVTVQLNQQLLTIRVPTRAIMTFYGECNLGLRVMNFKEAARHEF